MSWNMLILPIIIPAATAALTMACSTRRSLQQKVSIFGAVLLLASSIWLMHEVWHKGILVTYVGAWHAPFGITMVADTLAAIMVLITAITGLLVLIYGQVNFDGNLDSPAFQPVMHVLLLGICGSFLTGDIFNLYVWFEVMLLASFVLLALTGTRAAMEGALKYVTLNLISSAIFLSAVGITYAVCQSLNMADLAVRLELLNQERPMLVLALAMMFLVSFAIKAGLFPLYFWLPASYHTPSAAVSAIFGGLLTKVGLYALMRTFLTIFPYDERPLMILLALSALTMLTGVFGAISQVDIRRILSFHIISQIGYMVAGLGLVVATEGDLQKLAIAAAIFYTIHNIVVKTNLFLIAGLIKAIQGSYDLARLGGLATRSPWLAVIFLISGLSLAGIPPLSGFWAKLSLLKVGLEAGQYLVVAAGIITGLFTLLCMIKIWNKAFWTEPEEVATAEKPLTRRETTWMVAPIVVLFAMTLLIAFQPKPLFELGYRAAEDLLDRERYIAAVAPQSQPHFVLGSPQDTQNEANPDDSLEPPQHTEDIKEVDELDHDLSKPGELSP